MTFFHDDDFGKEPPIFNGENYYIWKYKMLVFITSFDFDAWETIEDGWYVPTHIVDGLTKVKPKCEWTYDDKKMFRSGHRAKYYMLCGISFDQYCKCKISECETAQQIWTTLRDIYEGTGEVKMARIELLTREYERFRMKPGENIHDMEMRFCNIVNHLTSLGKKIPNVDLVYKVLRSLSRKWQHKVRIITESRNLTTMYLGSLFKELQEHELDQLNGLRKNKEKWKTKKDSERAAASLRKDDEEVDSDDEMNLLIEDLLKFLKKKKKTFKEGKKKYKKRGSSSTTDDEEMNLIIEYIFKLLKKKKKSFKEGKKEHKERGSSSTTDDEEMNLLIEDLLKSFNEGKKEHKKRGTSSTSVMP